MARVVVSGFNPSRGRKFIIIIIIVILFAPWYAQQYAHLHQCNLEEQGPTRTLTAALKPLFSANPSHRSLSFSSSGLTT